MVLLKHQENGSIECLYDSSNILGSKYIVNEKNWQLYLTQVDNMFTRELPLQTTPNLKVEKVRVNYYIQLLENMHIHRQRNLWMYNL